MTTQRKSSTENGKDIRECPVLKRAAGLGMELKRTLHRLNKTLALCRRCSLRDECETTELIQEWVERAAQEVLDGLGA